MAYNFGLALGGVSAPSAFSGIKIYNPAISYGTGVIGPGSIHSDQSAYEVGRID